MTGLDVRPGPSGGGQHRRPARVSAVARATTSRLSWGLLDQAVSSLTNFAVGILVAQSLGATGFGIFTLAWVTYIVVLNVSRGLASDPLLVRFSGVSTGSWREATVRSTGTALLIGIGTGMVSIVVGAAVGGEVGGAFVALGLTLPGLLLQDSWRYAFFAAGEGRKAFTNDVVWGVALIPALLLAAGSGRVFDFVLGWGLAGAVAAGYGLVQTRVLPRLATAVQWYREQSDLGLRYLAENLSSSGGGQLATYGLGAITGLAAVGEVRGAQLLLGPFFSILVGISLASVPEAARVLRRAPHQLRRFCIVLGGGIAGAVLLWGLAMAFLLPDVVGAWVLGPVWGGAAVLILPTTFAVMNTGLCAGAGAGLRALGAARRSLRAQLVTASAYVSGGVVGAVVGGAFGSVCGVALATLLGATVWWWQLHLGLRDHFQQDLDATA